MLDHPGLALARGTLHQPIRLVLYGVALAALAKAFGVECRVLPDPVVGAPLCIPIRARGSGAEASAATARNNRDARHEP